MTTFANLTDPDAPELFSASFPRDGFPRWEWTARPGGLPVAAWTTETTHRDGQQGGLPLTVEAGVRIYDLMCAFTGASGGVRQAEFFVYRPADRRILQAALERHAGGAPVEPTTWIRAEHSEANRAEDVAVLRTALAHAREVILPGGHNLHQESPAALADAIRKALS